MMGHIGGNEGFNVQHVTAWNVSSDLLEDNYSDHCHSLKVWGKILVKKENATHIITSKALYSSYTTFVHV